MSPQQLNGEHSTHRDDIYSLGATIRIAHQQTGILFGRYQSADLRTSRPSMIERRKELDIEPALVAPVWEDTVAACLKRCIAAPAISN
jgi:hypothetical protein